MSSRGQTKVLASNIEINARQKLVLKKKLQDQNILPQSTAATSKPKTDPLRKVQEDSERLQRKAKREGMVGELGRLFLKGKNKQKNTQKQSQDDDDDDDDVQGLWEGWDEEEDDEELDIKDEDEWEDDEEEEEVVAVVPKANKPKPKKEKLEPKQPAKNRMELQRELSREDPSFKALDDSPGGQIEFSSIRSDNSEYMPARKTVEGNTIKVPTVSQPSKKDDVLNFGPKEDIFLREPTFKATNQANLLSVQGETGQMQDSRRNSRQSSRDDLGEHGSQRDLKNSDSMADVKSGRSPRQSIGSGGKSVGVLQVKKRDKSNLMNNLARIHAQRLEDANDAVQEEDEDHGDHEPKDVDWNKKIQMLMLAKEVKKIKIPGERMEERAQRRKEKEKGLDKWGVKSVPRKKNLEANKVSYRFKNKIEEEESKKMMAVNIEMLHTDELMAYYRELISKGKRDLTEHQKFQNQLKKLEYENTICNPRSVAKSRSKSPPRKSQIIDRFVKENTVQIKVSKPEPQKQTEKAQNTATTPSNRPKRDGLKTSKSKDKIVMRKTQLF